MWKLLLLEYDGEFTRLLCTEELYPAITKETESKQVKIVETIERNEAFLDPGGPMFMDTEAIEFTIDNLVFTVKAEHLLKALILMNQAMVHENIIYIPANIYTICVTEDMYKKLKRELSCNQEAIDAYSAASKKLGIHFDQPEITLMPFNIESGEA